jgi:hypothetical protein
MSYPSYYRYPYYGYNPYYYNRYPYYYGRSPYYPRRRRGRRVYGAEEGFNNVGVSEEYNEIPYQYPDSY